MTLKLNEVIFGNEPIMVTLISVCMVFFCGLGDQPTGPKYEVWQVFFLIMLLGLTPGGLPCFILFILFENMIRQITILAKETKSLNEKGREGGSSKLNDVAKKLPAHTVQLKMTAAVVLSTRDQTSKSSYSTVYARPISPKFRLHCIH